MKKGLWLIVSIMMLMACSKSGIPSANLLAENHEEEDGDKILSFYRQYGKAFSMKDMRQSFAKCDSLMAVYCSAELCRDTKEDRLHGIAYEFVTCNYGIDELSSWTLQVETEKDAYIVIYDFNGMDDRMQRKVKTVVLKMEMKNHKIDRVTDLPPVA